MQCGSLIRRCWASMAVARGRGIVVRPGSPERLQVASAATGEWFGGTATNPVRRALAITLSLSGVVWSGKECVRCEDSDSFLY